MTADLTASIHARLLNRAKARGEDFNLILTRYAIERFLYRLSLAPAREVFWLKGALLFDLWFDVPHRPTRDADFLGFGPIDIEALASTVREICDLAVEDGMKFNPTSITVEEIREEARYGGLRVRLVATLGNARCTVQLDVGYGDAVTPGPEEAIVSLGMANSRMKDYFDLRALAHEGVLGTRQLGDAIAATFQRRQTLVPENIPLGLSDEFAHDTMKQTQWKAFLGKNRLDAPTLNEVIKEVRGFVKEPLQLALQMNRKL